MIPRGSRDVQRASAYSSIFNNHFNKGKNKLLWYELIKCDIKCIEIHGSSEALVSPFSLKHFKSKTNKDSSLGKRGRHKKERDDRNGMFKGKEVFMTSHQVESNIERVTSCLGENRTYMT